MKTVLTALKWTSRIVVVAAIGLGVWQFIENRKLKAIISRPPPQVAMVLTNADILPMGNAAVVRITDAQWAMLTNAVPGKATNQSVTVFK